MILKLDDVKKVYRDGDVSIEALKNVSFNVNKGDMISIMGPSGSGKSTLLNIMGLMDVQTSGELYINDKVIEKKSIDKMSELRNKTVSFVFQDYNLIEDYNVYENVEMPLRYRGVRRRDRIEKVKDALKKVNLLDKLESKVNKLSGGQRQRVAIARALVGDGEIILADEPTGALDQTTGKEIMEILKRLNNDGKALIIVTHDPKIASQCTRHFLIVDGILTEEIDIKLEY